MAECFAIPKRIFYHFVCLLKDFFRIGFESAETARVDLNYMYIMGIRVLLYQAKPQFLDCPDFIIGYES